MAVETTPQVASTRQSIRITTQSQYNGGLFIMDSVHMPTGNFSPMNLFYFHAHSALVRLRDLASL
jgi:hypothetical protein